jgi:VCBS repeat-containing protein
MSDGAAQNGGTQAATTGEAAAVAGAAVAATAGVAPTAAPVAPGIAAPAAPGAAVPAASAAAVAVPAAVAAAQAAPEADCKPVKKKAHHHDKKESDEDHARATTTDEDQNLSQPADGCVLPQTGAQAAPAPAPQDGGAVVVDETSGGGISSGLLIGAGVLAAVGVGVLALAKGDDEDKNAPPVATADTGAVNEGATLTGSVATNDSDPNNDPLTYSLTGTAPAGLTLNSNGGFTFDANNAAYNALAAGATQVVTANYSVSDGRGGTANSTLTITVTGTNDAPTVTADTAAVNEDATITGNLRTNDTDPDTGATLTYTVLGTPPAGLTVNADGTYTFNAGNAAYQDLAAGATRVVTANIAVSDGTAPATNTTLTITVTGTNDAPVAVADVNTGAEDTTIAGSVATNDTDIDTPAANLVYSVVGTAPAGFTLNANGTYTLDTTNAAYQDLNDGQTRNVVVNYQVSDGQNGTATSTLTITVTGRTDLFNFNLDVDGDNNLNTRQSFDGAAGPSAFTDDDDVANTAVINNFGADDFLTFDAPFNGANRVAFANIDFDGDGVANDLAITTNKGGVVSDLILRNVLSAADAAGVISTEAAAEAAIGAGFDNFRTTTQSTAPTAASLDVDSDSNLTSIFTLPVSANTGTFAYTDDFTFANTVLVRDFGADDTLTFNTALANVSFASGDFDADGVADDLRITTNNGGVVSDIILADSVAAGVFVSTEAQAEAAIGNGADNFLFNGAVVPPPPPPPAGTTAANLDIDGDGNATTRQLFNAGTDGFAFTDSADVNSLVTIVNFGSNDRITFTGATVASYTNTDFDNDGSANDLFITINKGGVVSDIIIKDVVSPQAFVQDEASANAALNAALGTGTVDYFSFA